MARYRVVVVGADESDPLEHERAELKDIDCEIVAEQPQSEGEAMEAVRAADAILLRTRYGTRQVIEATRHCQILAVYAHGFDWVDVDACTEKGIMLTNGMGMCSEEVSNQAIAFVLALNRKLTLANDMMKAGRWDRAALLPIAPLDEQTLGIVGFGTIGRAVARKMSGWRMETLVYDPYVHAWVFNEHGVRQAQSLNELCSRSDYVVVQVPLNKETYHMFGEEQFRAMRRTANFINVCRGPVHDEKALTRALQEGWIAGAGLDVFEQEPTDPNNPLLKMDNVIAAPHSAGASTRSAWLSRRRAAEQVAAALRGEWPMGVRNPQVASRIPPRPAARSSQ
ncbi:MAG: C-terminal binding protein [Gemmatimonadetes bacterium]|nr:C-terminal binding protein [Gemmatimonadota bacterium]